MNKKMPTPQELQKEFKKLSKAHAVEEAANKEAKDLAMLMAEMFREFGTDLARNMFAEAVLAYDKVTVKEKALKKGIDDVKRKAWKWYGLAL